MAPTSCSGPDFIALAVAVALAVVGRSSPLARRWLTGSPLPDCLAPRCPPSAVRWGGDDEAAGAALVGEAASRCAELEARLLSVEAELASASAAAAQAGGALDGQQREQERELQAAVAAAQEDAEESAQEELAARLRAVEGRHEEALARVLSRAMAAERLAAQAQAAAAAASMGWGSSGGGASYEGSARSGGAGGGGGGGGAPEAELSAREAAALDAAEAALMAQRASEGLIQQLQRELGGAMAVLEAAGLEAAQARCGPFQVYCSWQVFPAPLRLLRHICHAASRVMGDEGERSGRPSSRRLRPCGGLPACSTPLAPAAPSAGVST
jgi:hypothetical protein